MIRARIPNLRQISVSENGYLLELMSKGKPCIQIKREIKIPVQGGLDPKVLLTDKENLKKEAKRYLDIFKDHPYIFNLGHGVLPETDPSMMDYLVKTVKDY